MLREIVWVIFDEIHYMQDRERGVVWEETIVGLPHVCRMVFLSATLSNAKEFAEWVASLHSQPCHVVYTEYRPTPLEHFGLPCQKQDKKRGGIYKICDKEGNFSMRMWSDLQAAGVLTADLPELASSAANVEGLPGKSKKRKRSDVDRSEHKSETGQPGKTEQPRKARRDLDMISSRVRRLMHPGSPDVALAVVHVKGRFERRSL